MKKFIAVLIIVASIFPAAVYSQGPTNKAECIRMLKTALQSQCTTLFGNDADKKTACLASSQAETEKQCNRFFSEGNFCSTCTSECTNNYKANDPKQKECLQMCYRQPGCNNGQ
jgi:hypothetical protein